MVAQPSPLTLELFHDPQRKPEPISCQPSSHPHALTTPNVLNLYTFTSSGHFMQWDHVICVLWRFISSTNNTFRACCSMRLFTPFCDWKIWHGRVYTISHRMVFVHSSVDWHVGCFYFLVLVNNTAMNTCVWASVWTCAFISLGPIRGRGIAGSDGNPTLSFLRTWRTADSGRAVLHAPQQGSEFWFFHILTNICCFRPLSPFFLEPPSKNSLQAQLYRNFVILFSPSPMDHFFCGSLCW